MKYAPFVLLLFLNIEILSYIALIILLGGFLGHIMKEAERRY